MSKATKPTTAAKPNSATKSTTAQRTEVYTEISDDGLPEEELTAKSEMAGLGIYGTLHKAVCLDDKSVSYLHVFARGRVPAAYAWRLIRPAIQTEIEEAKALRLKLNPEVQS